MLSLLSRFDQFNAAGQPVSMYRNREAREVAWRTGQPLAVADFDNSIVEVAVGGGEVQQPLGGRAAQHGLAHALGGIGVGTDVLENVEAGAGHCIFVGRLVIVIHIGETVFRSQWAYHLRTRLQAATQPYNRGNCRIRKASDITLETGELPQA